MPKNTKGKSPFRCTWCGYLNYWSPPGEEQEGLSPQDFKKDTNRFLTTLSSHPFILSHFMFHPTRGILTCHAVPALKKEDLEILGSKAAQAFFSSRKSKPDTNDITLDISRYHMWARHLSNNVLFILLTRLTIKDPSFWRFINTGLDRLEILIKTTHRAGISRE